MDRRPIPVFSTEQFQEASAKEDILSQHPCIVTGFVDQWPGFTRWTDFAFLSATFGHQKVSASAPQMPAATGESICEVQTSFGEYLEYLQAPDKAEQLFCEKWRTGDFEEYSARGIPLYCGNLPFARSPSDEILRDVHPILPPGVEDLNRYIPFFFDTDTHYWLYVSIGGALTPLHYDNNAVNAILGQLKGRKRATLFAPEDERHVRNTEFGWMDPENPQSDRFSSVQRATDWEAELVAGQALIFGSRWSHHVRTLESSVTVSYDFVNRSNLESFVRDHAWLECIGVDYLMSLFPAREHQQSPLEGLMQGLFGDDTRRAEKLCQQLVGTASRARGGPLGAGRIVAEATLQELLRDADPGTARCECLKELLREISDDRDLAQPDQRPGARD
jgi:hypothetical protein